MQRLPIMVKEMQEDGQPTWAGLSHCPQRPRGRGRAAHCAGSGCPLCTSHAAVLLPCPACSTAGPQ